MTFFAHSTDAADTSTWEPLEEHLRHVAARTRQFAAAFHSGEWGYIAGLWHDVGKYREEFQRRIRGSGEQAEHAAAGAALAAQRNAWSVAFAIAGHHTGLANRAARGEAVRRTLADAVEVGSSMLEAIRPFVPSELVSEPTPAPPANLAGLAPGLALSRAQELWTRFLFSCLVDADRLATETFYAPGRRAVVTEQRSMGHLRVMLDGHLARFLPTTPVNRLRADVLARCMDAATGLPGLYSLTVPTGGGKTLSGMAFALRHAEAHGHHRVIVVIPYTSIIEQTATVLRKALGEDEVIEHHSAFDEGRATDQAPEREVRRRLAVENWDAPVIVTTTVQFFETLFSDHPSRCRKLHNVARSVVIIDEAQTLPAGFLLCLIDGIKELVRGYGCTILLSTATQPALGKRSALPEGLEDVREIVVDPAALAQTLDRVEVCWPAAGSPPTPYQDLVTELATHEKVLAIVHTRRDARRLAELLPAEGRFHLSALMCAAHRAQVLDTIKQRVREPGHVCRVVATQLVEAGVDIDFPVVYRALGGLDSMAQAAGRCNREGTLYNERGEPRKGRFVAFLAETDPPPGARLGLAITQGMLARHGAALSLTNQRHFEEYFRAYYHGANLDVNRVMPEREVLNFATVGSKVHLIEDGFSHPVVVPWEAGPARVRTLIQSVEQGRSARAAMRGLQPFIVQVRERDLSVLRGLGAVTEIEEFGLFELITPFYHLYDPKMGLRVDADAIPDSAALVL